MSILGVVRIGRTLAMARAHTAPGTTQKATDKNDLTEAGPVSADAYWERIDYYLSRVVPVATEAQSPDCLLPA